MAISFTADNEREVAEVAARTEYSVDAFLFLLFTLHSPTRTTNLATHINAEKFCWNLRDTAFQLYGTNAKQQLSDWGVHTTEDFGVIMYSLIENGLALKNEHDCMDQFKSVYDFDLAFAKCPRKISVQFSLSLLFIMTTLAAVYAAGARINGSQGGASAMFTSWIAFLGGFCVFAALRHSSRSKLLLLLVGTPLLLIGIVGFYLVTFS